MCVKHIYLLFIQENTCYASKKTEPKDSSLLLCKNIKQATNGPFSLLIFLQHQLQGKQNKLLIKRMC
jgi:hypothetical protein